MILIAILNWVYKPIYSWGPHIVEEILGECGILDSIFCDWPYMVYCYLLNLLHLILNSMDWKGNSEPETIDFLILHMGFSAFNFPLNQSIDKHIGMYGISGQVAPIKGYLEFYLSSTRGWHPLVPDVLCSMRPRTLGTSLSKGHFESIFRLRSKILSAL